MKILRLRFQNLHSLQGKFEIDFTKTPLQEAGLFVITGATGSGKSTVLDALTLALYGRSARYDRLSTFEVMSRHTGECSAEVEFSCLKGEYRSVWQLRRARGLPGGNLQPVERRVVNLADEKTEAQKGSDADRLIVELTGLDYDRLLRSVLLAQGEFAAFLKASAGDRTELLEKVTGTWIYSDISMAAFREAKNAKTAHENLLLQAGNVTVLSAEEKLSQEVHLQEIGARLLSARAELKSLEQSLKDGADHAECERRAAEMARAAADLHNERQQNESTLKALAEHERAAPGAPLLSEVDLLQQQARKQDEELLEWRGQLPQRIAQLEVAAATADLASQHLQRVQQEEEASRPLLEEITQLDADLKHGRSEVVKRQEEKKSWIVRRDHLQTQRRIREEEHAALTAEISGKQEWLAAHQTDAALAAALADVQTALSSWALHAEQTAAAVDARTRLSVRLEEEIAQAKALEPAIRELEQRAQQAQHGAESIRQHLTIACADRVPAQWEQEREEWDARWLRRDELRVLAGQRREVAEQHGRQAALEAELQGTGRSLAAEAHRLSEEVEKQSAWVVEYREKLRLAERIQSLEEQVHLLKTGEPCPLCGSLEHPFADHGRPPSSEVAAVRKKLQAAEKNQHAAQAAHRKGSEALAAVEGRRKEVDVHLERSRQELERRRQDWVRKAKGEGLEDPDDQVALRGLLEATQAQRQEIRVRLKEIRKQEAELATAEGAEQKIHRELGELRLKKIHLDDRAQATRQDANKALEHESATRQALENQERVARQLLASHGESAVDATRARESHRRMRIRDLTYRQTAEATAQLGQDLAKIHTLLDGLRQQLDPMHAEVEQATRRKNEAEAKVLELQQQRSARFGTKSVQEERERWDRTLRDQRAALEQAGAARTRSEKELHAAQERVTHLTATATAHAIQLRSQVAALSDWSSTAGFSSAEEVRNALLPRDVAARHGALRRNLEEREQILAGQRKANESKRASLPESAATVAADLEGWTGRRNAVQSEAENIREQHILITQELRLDEERRRQRKGLEDGIATSFAERERWEQLSDLIGSADGAKFSKFAQGLTLERLVGLANQHLEHLNPRYSLRRSVDEAEKLNLDIVDHYQADATRSMQSLSGGESFLASLALALGLSDLAGGRRAIETLFIDEGFGTLDADTLETAMAALEQLQASGKTIGIISHIEAMKERIPTQIRITKLQGGRSELEVI